MMQYFEWDLENTGNHWNLVADQADELAEAQATQEAENAEGNENAESNENAEATPAE